MTHWERHTPEEAPARDVTWTPPVSPSASGPAPGPSGELGDASLWADWYHRASPVQQQEALLRAIQQGVVYAHQLAAPAGAAAPHRSLLSSLLNGQVKELEPLHPPALEWHDGALDRTQREAVARAVATPDVCLIQGFPGTGKSRLVAEIILQAARRGERILFLAATTAALDSVLERLDRHPAVCPIRCLAAEESPADLPAASARLTLPERLRSYRETTLPAARAARDAALQTRDARLRVQVQWPQLETLAEQYEQLAERLRILTARRASVADDVERLEPNAAFGERWQAQERARTEAVECLDGQLAGLQAELETITAKQAHLDSEWEAIRPLAEARQGRRLWTGAWWRALLRSGLREQVRDLEARRAELRAARLRLEQDMAARRSERLDIENRHAAERRRLQDEEIARRHAELDGEIAAVAHAQDALREQWRSLWAALPEIVGGILCVPSPARGACGLLYRGDASSAEISRQAVAAGRAAWERLREQDAQRAAAAEQWLQTVEAGVHTLPQKLAGCANVIAATTTALSSPHAERAGDGTQSVPPTILAGDAHLGDPPIFDLLILEEAHQVTESEFAAAMRRARRWVLIGKNGPEALTTAADPSLTLPARRPASRHFFQRLWQNLHADPHRLPFAWMWRDGRLLCRLRPLAAEQEKWIETEAVVDRPDIELRILSIPRQAPQVVEVLFPTCMGIAEAKQFLFHELEELAVETRGRGLCWSETADEVILELAPSADAETLTVALESGVYERVTRLPAGSGTTANGGMDWHTCSLGFARAAGWTRQRAEEWVHERLGLRWPGRTVLLTVLYRLNPPLSDMPKESNRESPRITRITRIKTKKR